jgi:hypothetical protein
LRVVRVVADKAAGNVGGITEPAEALVGAGEFGSGLGVAGLEPGKRLVDGERVRLAAQDAKGARITLDGGRVRGVEADGFRPGAGGVFPCLQVFQRGRDVGALFGRGGSEADGIGVGARRFGGAV